MIIDDHNAENGAFEHDDHWPILIIINFHNSGNAKFDQDYYDHNPDDNR